jgi:hypothetical protein
MLENVLAITNCEGDNRKCASSALATKVNQILCPISRLRASVLYHTDLALVLVQRRR